MCTVVKWMKYSETADAGVMSISCSITFLFFKETDLSPCSCLDVHVSCLVVSDYLQPHGLQPARLLCPWDSPGKNID